MSDMAREQFDAKIYVSGGGATATNCVAELHIDTINVTVVISDFPIKRGGFFTNLFGRNKIDVNLISREISIAVKDSIERATAVAGRSNDAN